MVLREKKINRLYRRFRVERFGINFSIDQWISENEMDQERCERENLCLFFDSDQSVSREFKNEKQREQERSCLSLRSVVWNAVLSKYHLIIMNDWFHCYLTWWNHFLGPMNDISEIKLGFKEKNKELDWFHWWEQSFGFNFFITADRRRIPRVVNEIFVSLHRFSFFDGR